MTLIDTSGGSRSPRVRLASLAALIALLAALLTPMLFAQRADAVTGHAVSGIVTGLSTDPSAEPGYVLLQSPSNLQVSPFEAQVQADGTYSVANVPAGDYIANVWQWTPGGVVYGGYYGGDTAASATVIHITNADVTGVDVAATKGVTISGTVGSGTAPAPLEATKITAYRWNGSSYDQVAWSTGWSGYGVGFGQWMPQGKYIVSYSRPDANTLRDKPTNYSYPYCTQYFDAKASAASAVSFTLAPGEAKTDANVTLHTACGSVDRFAGADRFETSAVISSQSFAPGVPVAFVSSGMNFPDALSGAPVAGIEGGPVLLTPPGALAGTVTAELTRLKPHKIVILGGTSVVSSAVQTQLAKYTTGSVQRIAGATRFDTSAQISAASFAPGVPVAFLANGLNFPDALSGAPVAGSQHGPVLLTASGQLPASISAELTRLKPQKIVVLGGENAISSAVASSLAKYTHGAVVRLAGADRFATSATISASTFSAGVPVAYIANALNFPDALAGAPVAAIQGGPVLLTMPGALPQSIAAELTRLKPQKIVILGGEAVVSPQLAAQLATYAPLG